MLQANDKTFIAAAKKLGLLTDEQLRECLAVLAERRALGVLKDLADVALEKAFLAPEGLKRIQALLRAAAEKTAPPTKPAAAAAAASEQDLIDGYQILGKLGEGATSTVYRARHRVLEKDVALKVLAPDLSKDAEYVGRFMREARAAAKLDHPNLVAIHDAGECRGRHFIAMELMEGLSLEKVVARDGPLSEIAALEIARDVARALGAAAEAKLVHRDVKPENILRTPEGRVKLLDLGIARDLGAARGGGALTEAGHTVGTPFYVSPEQARGDPLDARSDLYSLGVSLFFLATGERPFTGAAPAEVMRRHIADPVPSARVLRPGLSSGFDALLQKLMAKDPKRRYQSPRELEEGIEVLLSGAPAPEAPRREAKAPARAQQTRAAPPKPAPPPPPAENPRAVATRVLIAVIAALLFVLILVKSNLRAIVIPDRELADARRKGEEIIAGEAAGPKRHRERTPGAGAGEGESEAPEIGATPDFASALARMREFEAKGELPKARLALDRFIQTHKGSRDAERALDQIERLRAVEQEQHKHAIVVAPAPSPATLAKVERKVDPFAESAPTPEPAPQPEQAPPPAPGNPFDDPFGASPAPAPQPPPPTPRSGPPKPPAPAPAPAPAPEPAPVPASPAPPPPAPEPAAAAITKFERVFAAALRAPIEQKEGPALSVVYRLTKENAAQFADWERVKPPFSASSGAEGLEVQAVGKQPGLFRHVVPVVAPFQLEVALRIESLGAKPEIALTFGDQVAGFDFAASADLSIAKRKNGEATKPYAKAGPDPLKPGELRLVLSAKEGEVRLEALADGKSRLALAKIPEEECGGHLGFEIRDAKVVIREIKLRAQPEPAWLVERMKALKD